MIEVLPKLWRPKVTSRYRNPELDSDGVTNILDYAQYGKYVYKPELEWYSGTKREDLILFDCAAHTAKLNKNVSFNFIVNATTRAEITNVIK